MKKNILLKTTAVLQLVFFTGCWAPKTPNVPDITEASASPSPAVPDIAESTMTPSSAVSETPQTTAAPEEVIYTTADLENLEHTEYFTDDSIEHIFLGEVSRNTAKGYHYDGISDSPGEIIESTRSELDEHGVYTAKVMVDGYKKKSNNGYSSLFPDDYSPQDVIDAINEAYENGEQINGDLYAGLTSDGIEIDYYLDNKGRITTAYPIWEGE